MCWWCAGSITEKGNLRCSSVSKWNVWTVLPVWLENWTELMESTSNPRTWKKKTRTHWNLNIHSCLSWNSDLGQFLQNKTFIKSPFGKTSINAAGFCNNIKPKPWLHRTHFWQKHMIHPLSTWFCLTEIILRVLFFPYWHMKICFQRGN